MASYKVYTNNCNGMVPMTGSIPNYPGYILNYTINGMPQPPW